MPPTLHNRPVTHESRRQKMNLPYRKTCQVACALYAYTLRVVDSCRLGRKSRQWRVYPFGGTPENPNRHPFGLGFAVAGIGPNAVFPSPPPRGRFAAGLAPTDSCKFCMKRFFTKPICAILIAIHDLSICQEPACPGSDLPRDLHRRTCHGGRRQD
jgi:hypothetical protein